MPIDPSSGLPLDPATLQALQEQQLARSTAETGGSAASRMNEMTMGRVANTLFPTPQMQQARTIQGAMQQATASIDPQGDGESDLDFSIRQLRAQRDSVARFDPETAATMNTRLLQLGEMKFQQTRLGAQDQRAAEQESDLHAERTAELPIKQAIGHIGYVVTQDPKSEMGYSARAFDLTNQDDLQSMTLASRQPGAQVMSAESAAQLFSRTDVASMRVQQALTKAQIDANALSPEGLKLLAGQYAIDPTAMARQPPSVRAQVMNTLANVGLTPADMAAARAQIRFLNSDASTVGRRAGNIDILQNELQGMGGQVLTTLQGVNRTSFTGINALIAAGKTAISDPGEKAYAGAIQSFVNTYARVISGGTGQSTDSAREEAWALLRKADGPAAVQAAVRQLATNELGVVRNASSTAVEALAHPDKYGAILKIQQRLGFKMLDDDDSRFAGAATRPTTGQLPQQMPGQPALGSPSPQGQQGAPAAAIAYLQQHPEAAAAFHAKYGYLPAIGQQPSAVGPSGGAQ